MYGDWLRANARIDGSRLSWMYAGKYAFELSPDGTALLGMRHMAGKVARVAMERVLDGGPGGPVASRLD
jgi:hypothetical protein